MKQSINLKSTKPSDRQREEMRKLSQQLALEVAGALAEVQEERAKCEAFIAAIGDAISVHDTEYRIIYQNPFMRRITGDHAGEQCFRAYAGNDTVCADCLMTDAFRDGKLHRGEREFVHPGGKRSQLEFTVSPVRDASGKVVAAIELIRDISERKMSEWRLVTQNAVNNILAETPTVGEAIPLVLKAICEAIGWDVGGVWWVDRSTQALRLFDMWHRADLDAADFVAINRSITFAPGIGLPGRVWNLGSPSWIQDVLEDKNFPRRSAIQKNNLHAAFAFPIILGGAVVGVIEFLSREVREPAPGLLNALTPLGSQLGQLIERKWAEQTLIESERRFRETLENIRLLAIELDHRGNVIFCNDFVLELTGWKREELLGRNWFEIMVPDGNDLIGFYENWVCTGTMPTHHENDIVTRSGEYRFVSWNITVLYASDGTASGTACIGDDITERKKAEQELIHVSTHDHLTGLYNRAYFEEEVKRLERGRLFPVSIITIDVDGLKSINDSQGHEAGDKLIRMAAMSLLQAFRAGDVVARTGGDEFVVLLPETDSSNAEAAVARIRTCQQEANRVNDTLCLSMSIGMATAQNGQEIFSAMKLSDERMYREKFARKNMLLSGTHYDPGLQKEAEKAATGLQDLCKG